MIEKWTTACLVYALKTNEKKRMMLSKVGRDLLNYTCELLLSATITVGQDRGACSVRQEQRCVRTSQQHGLNHNISCV